jgi:nitrate reductase assembly molybdenum cofactor insertion protein NarJ
MSKSRQREVSAFRQGQIDRKEIDTLISFIEKTQKIRNKEMKNKYKERFPTKRQSNMLGSFWFRGWNNPNEKSTKF